MALRRFLMIILVFQVGISLSQTTNKIQLDLNSVPIKHFNFSNVHKDAQMWSAMYIASNNKIYIGLCTHGDAANVYEFDIETEKMRHLANLTVLLDERGRGIWTNGKIHVQMQELDGYIYFGSFCEDNGPPVIDASSYIGPYWFRINMQNGNVEVLSKINSFWGLLGQCMDKERRIIYGLTEAGHLCRYYIDEDYTEDMGRVDNWDICRTLLMDDDGNVYGSYPPGKIWKYDVEQDRIFDFEFTHLPVLNQSRSMANPMLDRKAQWRITEWDPINKLAYGIIGGTNDLFQFDVDAGQEGSVKVLSRLCAPQYRSGDLFDIPHATLAMTLSQVERKIYYIPVISGDFDYGAVELNVKSESKISETLKQDSAPPFSYILSYDLSTGERNDIGLLRAQDGRFAYGMGGAETDKEGKIWFVGAFEEPNKKYVVRKINGKNPYSMGLGCYDPFDN